MDKMACICYTEEFCGWNHVTQQGIRDRGCKMPTKRERISPEPKTSLRDIVKSGARSGVVDMAQHLWHSGCKEEVYPAGVGIGWGRFLKLVRQKWFLFQGWANGTATWEDTEGRFLAEAHKVLKREGNNN